MVYFSEGNMEIILADSMNTRYGLAIKTDNPQAFKNMFYRVRKRGVDEGMDEYTRLSLRQSPFDSNTLWVIKKPEEKPDATNIP